MKGECAEGAGEAGDCGDVEARGHLAPEDRVGRPQQCRNGIHRVAGERGGVARECRSHHERETHKTDGHAERLPPQDGFAEQDPRQRDRENGDEARHDHRPVAGRGERDAVQEQDVVADHGRRGDAEHDRDVGAAQRDRDPTQPAPHQQEERRGREAHAGDDHRWDLARRPRRGDPGCPEERRREHEDHGAGRVPGGARAHGGSAHGRRQSRPRRSARPGRAPVWTPFSTTSCPSTITCSMPSGNRRGSS